MALPKIVHPTIDVIIPSTKKSLKMRTMTVKEEKILLMAKEAENSADIMQAIKQVVNNCIVSKDKFDIKTLAIFDLEYLFIKLRGFSVSNIIKQTYTDSEDNKKYEVSINIDDLAVVFPKETKNSIQVDTATTIELNYPTITFYEKTDVFSNDSDSAYFLELFKACRPSVYSGNELFKVANSTDAEIQEFLDSLSSKTYNQINAFLDNLPSLNYVTKYTNSMGTERTITLSKLDDFFTLA